MRRNIQVRQFIELKPVEAQGARAQRHLGELGPPLRVELVAVNAHVARRVAVANDAGQQDEDGHANSAPWSAPASAIGASGWMVPVREFRTPLAHARHSTVSTVPTRSPTSLASRSHSA